MTVALLSLPYPAYPDLRNIVLNETFGDAADGRSVVIGFLHSLHDIRIHYSIKHQLCSFFYMFSINKRNKRVSLCRPADNMPHMAFQRLPNAFCVPEHSLNAGFRCSDPGPVNRCTNSRSCSPHAKAPNVAAGSAPGGVEEDPDRNSDSLAFQVRQDLQRRPCGSDTAACQRSAVPELSMCNWTV